jgi:hypothetical protein
MSFSFKTLATASLLAAVGCTAFAQTSTRTGISTPVYSVERTTTYSSNQRNFDNATAARVRDLNAGRNFYNDRQAEVRTTVDTHTVGGSFMGVWRQPQPHRRGHPAQRCRGRAAHLRAHGPPARSVAPRRQQQVIAEFSPWPI